MPAWAWQSMTGTLPSGSEPEDANAFAAPWPPDRKYCSGRSGRLQQKPPARGSPSVLHIQVAQ